ncbi:uncharacterized protein LOC100906363 [Galendromus occidentalis]|uniref:Uncharacterized protein LOC100906363 n=1 Tax=Galendromus occidentalis TaxID=34638 RepID=A0AAJ6VYR1_9ACAR|nr:uncharacterized protein LOC100906363 [Galendromus occidentalis]
MSFRRPPEIISPLECRALSIETERRMPPAEEVHEQPSQTFVGLKEKIELATEFLRNALLMVDIARKERISARNREAAFNRLTRQKLMWQQRNVVIQDEMGARLEEISRLQRISRAIEASEKSTAETLIEENRALLEDLLSVLKSQNE